MREVELGVMLEGIDGRVQTALIFLNDADAYGRRGNKAGYDSYDNNFIHRVILLTDRYIR
jgi:hypothetical protein